MKKTEITLWILFLTSIILKILGLKIFTLALLFFGIILSCYYFLFSTLILNDISIMGEIGKRFTELGFVKVVASFFWGVLVSWVVVAFVFKALAWPGAKVQLYGFSVILAINTISAYTKWRKHGDVFHSNMLKRNKLLIGVAVIFIITTFLPVELQKKIYQPPHDIKPHMQKTALVGARMHFLLWSVLSPTNPSRHPALPAFWLKPVMNKTHTPA